MDRLSGIHQQARLSDSALVGRILNGETELFRLVAERYAERMMRMVGRLVPSKEDAEEVTQDALLEAYKSLSRFDEKQASFPTWLLRIAYHMALKHYRKRLKTVPLVETRQDWLNNMSDEEADELLADTSSDRLSLLEKATEMLKPDDRMLLSLYYFDGYSIKEISSITGHDGGYLRSRLQWIRKKLAATIKLLEKNGEQVTI